jgi:phenylacetate-CoA ligase
VQPSFRRSPIGRCDISPRLPRAGRRAAVEGTLVVDVGGLSIIVPCLNEAAGLRAFFERIRPTLARAELAPVELILVDDGSTDGTWAEIEALARESGAVRGRRHDARRGIPAAWRTGVAAARGDTVCVIDADLQYDPEEIARLWSLRAATGADVVQGARADGERPRDLRYALSRGLCGLLNRVFGMSARDNKSGFFLCGRDAFAALLDYRGTYRHWQCYVMVAAHHRGLRIHEVETPFRPRRSGQSAFGRLALGPTLGVAADLVTALREYPPRRS